jgi:hypothetical protein
LVFNQSAFAKRSYHPSHAFLVCHFFIPNFVKGVPLLTMKYSLILALFLITAAFACTKPRLSESLSSDRPDLSIAFATSLADTIPLKNFQALNIADVAGMKFRGVNGKEVRYFSYEVDKKNLLRVVSQLPAVISDSKSDTLCRLISVEVLKEYETDPGEIQVGNYFWNSSDKNEIYECVKGSVRHTMIFEKSSNKVHHRIEYLRG